MIYHQRQQHDAIVIGSGITGGWAAKELCEKGLKTLVLERGRNVEHGKDYITEHKQSWEMEYRGRAISRQEAERDWPIFGRRGGPSEPTKHFYLNGRENPYIEEKPFHLGPRGPGRRAIAHMGPAELPVERPRLRSQCPRRARR